MVACINSLIVSALLTLFMIWIFGPDLFQTDNNPLLFIFPVIIFFLGAWGTQMLYVMKKYDTECQNKENQELEATLLICSENPQEVVGQVASLTGIEDYRLLPQDSSKIHDIYFDTPDAFLNNKKIALRLRQIGKEQWITLKGPSYLTGWGSMERLEIEESWSKKSLINIFNKLVEEGFELPHLPEDFDLITPREVMTGVGLKVIQDRVTSRQIRNIVYKNVNTGPILAELAIDSVMYSIGNENIHHNEVEIEAKMQDSEKVIQVISKHLIERFKPALCKWDHSKLATGKAIDKLLDDGVAGLLDVNNNIKPEAYDKIDDILKKDIHI